MTVGAERQCAFCVIGCFLGVLFVFRGPFMRTRNQDGPLSRDRDALLKDCGEICQTGKVVGKDQYFEFIEKKIDCTAIFHELPSGMTISPPPQDIPKELVEEYSLGGAVRLSHRYFNETQTGGKLNITWSASMIDREVEHVSNEKFDQMSTTTSPRSDRNRSERNTSTK